MSSAALLEALRADRGQTCTWAINQEVRNGHVRLRQGSRSIVDDKTRPLPQLITHVCVHTYAWPAHLSEFRARQTGKVRSSSSTAWLRLNNSYRSRGMKRILRSTRVQACRLTQARLTAAVADRSRPLASKREAENHSVLRSCPTLTSIYTRR